MKNFDKISIRLAEEIKTIGLLSDDLSSESYDMDILISGLVDSYGFVQFLMFVENEYGFEISEEMQFEDQVRTINGMADLIRKEAK